MSSSYSPMPTRPMILIGLILSLIFVLGWSPSAAAVGNLKLGPVGLHPYFQIAESYDSNVCRTENMICQNPNDPTKSKDANDWVTLFSPGLQVALPYKISRFEAEYRGDWARYDDIKFWNYSDNLARGRFEVNFPGGLSLRAKEDWNNGHDAPGYGQSTQITFYHRNTAGGGADFEVGPKLRLAADFTNMILNYADNAQNGYRDRIDNTVGGTIYYKFLPKTSALLEYTYTATNFGEVNPGPVGDAGLTNIKMNNKAQRGYLGLTWDISTRSHGTVKAGYSRKDYQESGLDNFQGGILSMALSHELTRRTSLKFDAVRDVEESNVVNQPYYLTFGGRVALNHDIHPKVSLKLKTGFSRDQYPNDQTIGTQTRKRMDDTWDLGGGLEYRIQEWLEVGLGYDFTQRRSTFSDFGYVDNLYTFSVKTLL
jgi:polysaccharide biosynthesis protein VpsM